MVDPPALRGPLLLGDEEGRHERLEHAAAPARDDPGAVVRVGALEDGDPAVVRALYLVGSVDADRLRLLPAPVARVGECPPLAEIGRWRQFALGDPDVGRDAALTHDRVVAARRIARLGLDVERDAVDPLALVAGGGREGTDQ